MAKDSNLDSTCDSREAKEELDKKFIAAVEVWCRETFFKGPSIDEVELHEGLSWLYSSDKEKLERVRICSGPLEAREAIRENQHLPRLQLTTWTTIMKLQPSSHVIDISNVLQQTFSSIHSPGLIIFRHLEDIINLTSFILEDDLFHRYFYAGIYEVLHSKMRRYRKGGMLLRYFRYLRSGCFLSLLLKNIAIICRRPRHVLFNNQGQLHCDGGAAIEWQDDCKFFYLNDVPVTEEIAITPAKHLDPELILKERNAEVRREIVRKIGIERVLKRLGGKIIDSWQGYELITLNVPDMEIRPVYLKMTNPSIGTYHVEGVPPEIVTCRDALRWRTGGLEWIPEQLT